MRFLASSAASLAIPSLTALGAASTKSLASLRPKPVISRTIFSTAIFLSAGPGQSSVRQSSCQQEQIRE